MRSIFVRVEPTVRLVTDAVKVASLIVLHFQFEAELTVVVAEANLDAWGTYRSSIEFDRLFAE
jgi:hypothetical protein